MRIKKLSLIIYCCLLFIILLPGCRIKEQIPVIVKTNEVVPKDSVPTKTIDNRVNNETQKKSELEQILISNGLVNISDYDTSIKVLLKYSTIDNFLNRDLYGDLDKAYLPEPVVKQLIKAQKFLKDTFPDLSIIIFDAVRPLSIQKIMWDPIKVTKAERLNFLSNPAYGSLHNFGAAVDVSLFDTKSGKELDMGTPYDSFDKTSYPLYEKEYLRKGILTLKHIENRKILRIAMKKALFTNIPTEWWHFNACSRKEARNFFPMVKYHTLKPKHKIKVKNPDQNNVSFKVQIKISPNKIDLKDNIFKNLEVSFYYHKGIYKYVTGNFKDLAAANEKLSEVEAFGFKDAFIVAFNNDERIEIKDAIELLP